MNLMELTTKLDELRALPKETEWLEFKENYAEPNDIGQRISALSNAAALLRKQVAYYVWGIDDETHAVTGTTFDPQKPVQGNQSLQMWLVAKLDPTPGIQFYQFTYENKPVVMLEIRPVTYRPVKFDKVGYIRVDSHKTTLDKYPEKERALWNLAAERLFEQEIAMEKATTDQVLDLLDYASYFELSGISLPDKKDIFGFLVKDKLINDRGDGHYSITNLGAILFAKELPNFSTVARKAVRVIQYRGKNKINTLKEQEGRRGYASAFGNLIAYIDGLLPENELVGQAFRKVQRMYPQIAIRELVANALIHQDFRATGMSTMIELYDDRLEITNPGQPLIDTLRLIDEPPRSRNEMMASLMKRFKICEERGSGIKKVVASVELFQLPAPEFIKRESSTQIRLFAHKPFRSMGPDDKIRACYQHACLRYVSNEDMTNASLRERLGLNEKNYPSASRIIADTIQAELIKPKDPDNTSKKHAKYVPFWAP